MGRSRSRRVLAAVTLSILGVVLAALLWPNDTSPLQSFYFEASIEGVTSDGTRSSNRISAWYESPGRWRWESGPQGAPATVISLSDGTRLFTYNGESSTHDSEPLPAQLRGTFGTPPEVWLGPLRGGSVSSVFDRLPDTEWRYLGINAVLGRIVRVLEVHQPGRISKFWVDEEHDFVLRHEKVEGNVQVQSEILDLSYNPKLPEERFLFRPQQNVRPGQSLTSAPPFLLEVRLPPGFLEPAYLPAGFIKTASVRERDAEGKVTWLEIRMQLYSVGGSWPFVLIEEKLSGTGATGDVRAGEKISVAGREAYRLINGDEIRLTFSSGDLAISVISRSVSWDELLRVVESLQRFS